MQPNPDTYGIGGELTRRQVLAAFMTTAYLVLALILWACWLHTRLQFQSGLLSPEICGLLGMAELDSAFDVPLGTPGAAMAKFHVLHCSAVCYRFGVYASTGGLCSYVFPYQPLARR
ncbi:hypothetical protein PG994_000542 [Apiospora phragmitis]|uniref:Uncharacterized protein n=1 Tax=Apiospora phragmitis TaxID=2905665 RepID=A0ABR1X6S4_9PEZI